MSQADYEIRLEHEHDASIKAQDDEYTLTLTLGENEVEVFYVVQGNEPCISGASWHFGFVPFTCFSNWQLDDWRKSIRNHLRAEEERHLNEEQA